MKRFSITFIQGTFYGLLINTLSMLLLRNNEFLNKPYNQLPGKKTPMMEPKL